MKLIGKGKSKDVYEDDGDVVFEFTNRTTAFDGIKFQEFEQKGEILCTLSAYWFAKLEAAGVPTHFIRLEGKNKMRVKKVTIVPLEVIFRNRLAGSLWTRFKNGEVTLPPSTPAIEGAAIPGGFLEFTTKFEPGHDVPISKDEILRKKWSTPQELDYIEKTTRKVNEVITGELAKKDIVLVDFKVEYGRDATGKVLLADEVGTPDGCRFWIKSTFEKSFDPKKGFAKGVPPEIKLDKDRFRFEEGVNLTEVYRKFYERMMGKPYS